MYDVPSSSFNGVEPSARLIGASNLFTDPVRNGLVISPSKRPGKKPDNSLLYSGEGKTVLQSERDGVVYEAVFARGRFCLSTQITSLPMINFGDPFSPESSGSFGDGIGKTGNSNVSVWVNHSIHFATTTSGPSCGTDSFCAGSSFTALDTYLNRESAAVWQLGLDAASPVAYTLKGGDSRAGTDSNTAGGDLTIAAGRGTGTAKGGQLNLQTAGTGTTGTAANSLVTRKTISSVIAMTNNTDLTVATFTLGASQYVSGVIHYSIEVTDGTDFQTLSGVCSFAAVDKAGTYTVLVTESTKANAESAGTNVVTWSIAGAAGSVTVKAKSNSSLTPTRQVIIYTIDVGNSLNLTAVYA